MNPTWAAALATSLALAGCLGGPAPDSPDPVDPDAKGEASVLGTFAIVDPGGGRGEPGLGMSADGTLFVNGYSIEPREVNPLIPVRPTSPTLYASDDEGRTWSQIAYPLAPLPDLDPILTSSADGTIWHGFLYLGVCNYIGSSSDNGETWLSNHVGCATPTGDRPHLVGTRNGEAFLFWRDLETYFLEVARTTDYGATWDSVGSVEPVDHHLFVNGGSSIPTAAFWSEARDAIVVAAGRVHFEAPVAGILTAELTPGFAISSDDGATWTWDWVPAAGHGFMGELPFIGGDSDDAGAIYLAWSEWTEDDSAVFMVASRDGGTTWTDPRRIDTTTDSEVWPVVVAGGAGEVVVAWYQADRPGFPEAMESDTSWNLRLVWTDDFWSGARWGDGLFSNGTVKRGNFCVTANACDEGVDRSFLDFFTLKRMADGRVVAAYNDGVTPFERNPNWNTNVLTVVSVSSVPLLSAIPGPAAADSGP